MVRAQPVVEEARREQVEATWEAVATAVATGEVEGLVAAKEEVVVAPGREERAVSKVMVAARVAVATRAETAGQRR